MEGDDDEEDIDDLEHEFNIEDECNKQQNQNISPPPATKLTAEAMLYGKMSYGRGPEEGDNETPQFPAIIAGTRSRAVIKYTFGSNIHTIILNRSLSYENICSSGQW